MSLFSSSLEYYENSYQKLLTKKTAEKNDEVLSNISFSDEKGFLDKKTQNKKEKPDSKFLNESNNKDHFISPFSSIFEINTSSKQKKQNGVASTQENNIFSTQFSKDKIDKVQDDYLRVFFSQNSNLNANKTLKQDERKVGNDLLEEKDLGKKGIYGTPINEDEKYKNFSPKNLEKKQLKSFAQKINTDWKKLKENDGGNENNFFVNSAPKPDSVVKNLDKIIFSKEDEKQITSEVKKLNFSQNDLKMIQIRETEKISHSIIRNEKKVYLINQNYNEKTNEHEEKKNTVEPSELTNKKEKIFNPPSFNRINYYPSKNKNSEVNPIEDQNKTDEKPKNYLDIFKNKIDQKKVNELTNQAKQNTLFKISKEALPNKKEISNYIQKISKKNQKETNKKQKKPEGELTKIYNTILFPNEVEKSENNPQLKRKRTNYLFQQEAENNSSEESLSDVDEVSSFEGDGKHNLELDFEQFFESNLGNPLKINGSQKKGKINKKLEKKAKRVRILKEKKVKEYLQETRFTYTSRPLRWRKIPENKEKLKPNDYRLKGVGDFTAKSGIKIPHLLNAIEPYDFFIHFMPEKIFEEVARLTNISASLEFYSMATNKNKTWKEATPNDIKKWFGLIFLFGIVRKYSVNEYWSSDPLLGINSVNRIMNKQRFNDLRRYICFYDKRKKSDFEKVYPPLDPFYKFRFLIDHINEVCRKTYVPEKELSVDESMISYQGIHRLKVFMPRKPTKWGFKAFVLAEASSGYVLNMIINEGHKRGENEDLLSKRIVLQILHGFENQGFHVYMDRWYTSSDLLTELKRRGIGGCGTIFLSRVGLVNDLRKDVREFKDPGEAVFYTNDEMTFVAFYQYHRQVYVLSNFHSADWIKMEKVRKIAYFCKKEYKIYDYDAPLMIREYNIFMGGVDLFNQRVSYYNVDYDIMKWYMRLVFWIFEIAMINSYLIYCKSLKLKGLKPLATSEYRVEIIKRMTQWAFDPTKPVFRKGVSDQVPENENEAIDREFHNLNAKRKNLGDADKANVFSEMRINIKCTLEYIGIGTCDFCRRKRRKLKKTDFWCRGCQKGVCLICFEKHRMETIFSKLAKHKETQYLINYMITKKRIKVETTSEFYEMHVRKKRKIEKPDEEKKEKETINGKESTMSQTNPSVRNEKITKMPIVIEDKLSESSSSSNESLIMNFKTPGKPTNKFAFKNYLQNKKEKNEEIKEMQKNKEDFHQLKEDFNNFFSDLGNNNDSKKKLEKEEKIIENLPKQVEDPKLNESAENEKDQFIETNQKVKVISVGASQINQDQTDQDHKSLIFQNPFEKPSKNELIRASPSINLKNDNMGENKEIRLKGRHFPSANPHGRQVKCAYCKIGNSRRTIGFCTVCQVPLCPLYCFEKYHTEETLK